MPTVHHPRALDAVDGHPPARVTVNGESYPVEDGKVILPSQNAVEQLARAYDLSPEDLDATESEPTCAGNDGECSRTVEEPGAKCWQHAE